MRVASILLALAVSLAFIGKLSAADQTAPTAKPQHHEDGPWGAFKDLNLTDAQKAKVRELGKEYGPKFKAAADSVLTADQKKVRDSALKAAKDAGKKGPEVLQAVGAAMKLTDAQKAKMKAAVEPVAKAFRERMKAILTPAQQEQLKAKMAKYAPGKPGPQAVPPPQCHSSHPAGEARACGHGRGDSDGKWQGHHGHHEWGQWCHHGHHGHHHGHHGHHGDHEWGHCCHHGHHGHHHGHHEWDHCCHHGHHGHHHGHHGHHGDHEWGHCCHHGHHGHHHGHHGHHGDHEWGHCCHHKDGHHGEIAKTHGWGSSTCPSAGTCPMAKQLKGKCLDAAKAVTGAKAIEAQLAALEKEKADTLAALKRAEQRTKVKLSALEKQRQETLITLAKAKKAEKEPAAKKKN